jgi:hypothetical protein
VVSVITIGSVVVVIVVVVVVVVVVVIWVCSPSVVVSNFKYIV